MLIKLISIQKRDSQPTLHDGLFLDVLEDLLPQRVGPVLLAHGRVQLRDVELGGQDLGVVCGVQQSACISGYGPGPGSGSGSG